MPPSIRQTTYQETGYAFDETYPPYHGGNWRTTRDIQKDFNVGYGGNYGWPKPPPNSDIGHPMTLVGFERIDGLTPIGRIYEAKNSPFGYAGNFNVKGDNPWWGNPVVDGAAWGATAYSRMKPTKPSFQGLNSLFELREAPQILDTFRKGIKSLKDGGNYHLNLQFGVLPLISDLRTLLFQQQEIQKRLNQLLRDNGRPVRRRIVLQDNRTDGSEGGEAWGIVVPNGFKLCKSTPRFRRNVVVMDRVWASAQFRFHLPPGPQDVEYKKKLLARLYGNRITPSVLYNAIPWTWLIDWFSNVGDIIQNLDTGVADRCAADWFYVMRHTETRSELFGSCDYMRKDGTTFQATGTALTRSFVKTRLKGSPFGFGINPNGLNTTQLAILGALGMSRI